MRTETLTAIKGGLNRLRTKGAALNDSLYDLLNGFVTTEKTVKVRPGTLLSHTIQAGTIGLVGWGGKFHVFASSDVAGLDTTNFELHVLRAPDGSALAKIHFAEPFLGALYVAAEFADGDTYHFWLQAAADWAANTYHDLHDLVQPTSNSTYVFRATRLGAPYPAWTPSTPRAVGDKVEPTTYNGLYFEVTSVVGTNPRSGTTEPNFNVEVGATVVESVDGTLATPDPTPIEPTPPPTSGGGGGSSDRYVSIARN